MANHSTRSSRRARFSLRGFVALSTLLLLLLPQLAGAKKEKPEDQLPEKYRQWLEHVQLLISKEERESFLALLQDYQRDAFIDRFWKVRDPYPGTARNEFRENWEERLRFALEEFGNVEDERSQILLLHGEPAAREVIDCATYLWPAEVWYYKGSDQVGFEFLLLFYQRWGKGLYRLWEPFYGIEDIAREPAFGGRQIRDICGVDSDALMAALSFASAQGTLGATTLFSRLKKTPEPPEKEWVATFGTYSTELTAGSTTFEAQLDVAYPGHHQSRTVLQGTVLVPIASLKPSDIGGYSSYNLLLNGEILRGAELFERFRYKFDPPKNEIGEKVPLVFQRYLRPGEYKLLLRIEDVNTGHQSRIERTVTVPEPDALPPPVPADPETARLLAEANAAIAAGENTVKIVPLSGEWQTGLVRIDTLVTGEDVAKVTFYLDNTPILTKKRPPYSVELDLGSVPRGQVLRVEGFNAADQPIASDETTLNAGQHRFSVRLVEPHRSKHYTASIRAQADVVVPEGEVVERVEYYLNETLVSTLYQEPWIQPILLPQNEPTAYVRVLAYLTDGSSTEDVVFVNAPDYLENVDVQFVELYATVLDRELRPVEGLEKGDFKVLEDEVAQEVVRFELVRNLPIHVATLLDVSASMEGRLEQAQAAALHFFEQAITPKDRGAIITFNDHPNLTAKYTNQVSSLAAGLAGLKPERGTALWDSLIFALYYFNGIKGQRAILLLSDGKDESSRYSFAQALEFAQRAGVAIYAIGLDLKAGEGEARRGLNRLASETGGRSFFVDDAAQLQAIYDTIQRELRSRYLLAYQSSNTSESKSFRTIEVTLAKPGLEVKTMRGYFP